MKNDFNYPIFLPKSLTHKGKKSAAGRPLGTSVALRLSRGERGMMKKSASAASAVSAKVSQSSYSSISSVSTLGAAIPLRLHVRNDLHLARKVWHVFLGLSIVSVYLLSGMPRSSAVIILGCLLGVDLLIEITRLRVPAFNESILRG